MIYDGGERPETVKGRIALHARKRPSVKYSNGVFADYFEVGM